MTDALLDSFFASGRYIDVVIALTVAEGVALWLYRRATGRGPRAAAWLPNLAAGLALMIALKAALAGAPWPWVALALAAAGVSHALDWRARLRGTQ